MAHATRKPGQDLAFTDVKVGDHITFLTRDNGFGGSGGQIKRDGTVKSVTDKTVTVEGVRMLRWSNNWTGTARLRRADWYDRSVRLAESEAGQ